MRNRIINYMVFGLMLSCGSQQMQNGNQSASDVSAANGKGTNGVLKRSAGNTKYFVKIIEEDSSEIHFEIRIVGAEKNETYPNYYSYGIQNDIKLIGGYDTTITSAFIASNLPRQVKDYRVSFKKTDKAQKRLIIDDKSKGAIIDFEI